MIKLKRLHHVAIICSDYERSKQFYTSVLGCKVINEHFRSERQSYKLDLAINEFYTIELFSFRNPPKRTTKPEAAGLRHIAFEVYDIAETIETLRRKNIVAEPVRVDEFTGKRFTFISDPDELPIEFYES